MQMPTSSDTVNVIAKPPTIYLISILIGLFLQWLLPFALWGSWLTVAGGFITITAGLTLAFWGENEFKQRQTSVNLDENPTRLVTSGPYQFTRNPMYVGLMMFQLGLGLLMGSMVVILMLIPTLWLLHYGVVLREEAYLSRHFGRAYNEYSGRVRRWL